MRRANADSRPLDAAIVGAGGAAAWGGGAAAADRALGLEREAIDGAIACRAPASAASRRVRGGHRSIPREGRLDGGRARLRWSGGPESPVGGGALGDRDARSGADRNHVTSTQVARAARSAGTALVLPADEVTVCEMAFRSRSVHPDALRPARPLASVDRRRGRDARGRIPPALGPLSLPDLLARYPGHRGNAQAAPLPRALRRSAVGRTPQRSRGALPAASAPVTVCRGHISTLGFMAGRRVGSRSTASGREHRLDQWSSTAAQLTEPARHSRQDRDRDRRLAGRGLAEWSRITWSAARRRTGGGSRRTSGGSDCERYKRM